MHRSKYDGNLEQRIGSLEIDTETLVKELNARLDDADRYSEVLNGAGLITEEDLRAQVSV